MPKISILKKNKIKMLLRFGLYTSLIFALIFFIDTKKFYFPQVIIGFIFGVMVGLLEELTSHRKFLSISVPIQFLFKILGIILIIFLLSSILILSFVTVHEIDLNVIWSHFNDKEVSSPVISAFVVAFTVSTYFQIEKLIGKNLLINYLKGRYRKPKKEIRVFLFMDLKSSTTLSEKLGNDTYYSFLNDAIYEMSASIVETKAEIYQYVGDEIVFTWTLDKGITNNNCLRLFEKICEELENKKSYFLKNYGYQPKFKAALHAGIVLAAEIGHIKKGIIYSGDVLNTTARMESLCNKYEANVLISKSLFNLLDKKHEILYEDLGSISLKGKDEKLELIKIHLSDSSYTKERKELEKVLKGK
ncbi:MAG: adenylate/guanylate cyclase domain-containing protein [Cyclobacteriaceae bacterium]|nr:adenylate/guanylate cyclase domain-containing protein [Cyclobacteriaceae bacterium]